MVDQEAMFDDQEAMLDDQEAMFDDQEAMCVLMHFLVQPSFDLGCDNFGQIFKGNFSTFEIKMAVAPQRIVRLFSNWS